MFRDIKLTFGENVRSYPFKRRTISALTMCIVLLVTTADWHFEPAKTIAIGSGSIARLFDIKGRWFMLFFGICIGDMLLYLWR